MDQGIILCDADLCTFCFSSSLLDLSDLLTLSSESSHPKPDFHFWINSSDCLFVTSRSSYSVQRTQCLSVNNGPRSKRTVTERRGYTGWIHHITCRLPSCALCLTPLQTPHPLRSPEPPLLTKQTPWAVLILMLNLGPPRLQLPCTSITKRFRAARQSRWIF